MAIKEAKATCACSIQEAETLCSMAIRDAEAEGATQDGTLQKSHAKSILHLKEQAIEEENKSQLDFLSACQTALLASPVELCSMLVASYQVLMGQELMSLLCNQSQGASSSEQVPVPVAPPSPAPEPLPRPKQQYPSPDPVHVMPPGRATSQASLTGPPSSKQWEVMPLYKALTASHLEAFNWDSPWWGRQGRSTLGSIAQTSAPKTPVTCEKSFGKWAWLLSYLAPLSMKLKKHGWGQTSCNKQTMH